MIKSKIIMFSGYFACFSWVLVLMSLLFFGVNPCGAQENPLSLEIAISEAIGNNMLIQEAIEKQRAAMENEKSAAADLFPKFSAGYGYNNFGYNRTLG